MIRSSIAIAGVALLALLAFANSLRNEFVWDDHYNVVDNQQIRELSRIGTLFTQSIAAHADTHLTRTMNTQYYRPLTMATYALDHALFGLRPALFHAHNVALHVLCSVVVLMLGLELFGRGWREGGTPLAVLLGAAIFAVHPVHSEAVDVITYRADLLAGLALLSGVLFWIRGSRLGGASEGRAVFVWTPLTYAAGQLAKEMAITLPLLVALWDTTATVPRSLSARALRLAPLVGLLGGYLLLRRMLLSPSRLTYFAGHGPTAVALTMVGVFGLYVRLLLVPWPLNPFYDWSVLPVQTSLLSPVVIQGVLALGLLIGGLALSVRRRRHGITLCLALLPVGLLPVSQVVPIIVAAGERFLYAASAGPCLLLGQGAGWLMQRRPRCSALVGVAVIGVLVVFFNLTVIRNTEWRTDRSVLEANVADFPRSQNAWLGLARLNEQTGRLREALPIYERLGLKEAARRVRIRIIHEHQGAHEDTRHQLLQ